MKTEEYLKKIYTMLIVVLVISIMSLLIGLVNYSNTKGTTIIIVLQLLIMVHQLIIMMYQCLMKLVLVTF